MLNQSPIVSIKLLDKAAITRNESATSVVVDLRQYLKNGSMSVHYIVSATGSPSFDITYTVCSTVGGTYLAPSTAVAIGSALSKGSDVVPFVLDVLAPFLKIVVTEKNVADIASIELWLNIQ